MTLWEVALDGLVGPSHNYAGLSVGNRASAMHGGAVSRPRDAALQGLAKARFVMELGVPQGILPPIARPDLAMLRRLGFCGTDAEVLDQAAEEQEGVLLRNCWSASSMWAANALTAVPSCDSEDGKVHLVPANLVAMFHRSLEPRFTTRVLRKLFADESRFRVHDPLPFHAAFGDEGSANQARLATELGVTHLLAWGRSHWGKALGPDKFPARQTLEASQALARLHRLKPGSYLLPQQDPLGIDGGAFHTDVLGVGTDNFLMYHERAFYLPDLFEDALRRKLGDELDVLRADESELPLDNAVKAYPFNAQLVRTPKGHLVIVAPKDAEEDPASHRFLTRVVEESRDVAAVHFLEVRESMKNGGGPACLRARIWLNDDEIKAVAGRVMLDPALCDVLENWIRKHYREELRADDLRDPQLVDEVRTALDALTGILRLGSLYDFQAAP